jgi:hypothetical protein
MKTYTCATCGKEHGDLPDMAADRPDIWWSIPEEERSRRLFLDSDLCVLDNEHFFIRGVIQLPIIGTEKCFGFGAWVSQKRENFQAYIDQPDITTIGPFFGWLSTNFAYYPAGTLNLQTRAHFRGGGVRPTIEVEPTDHPLALDQRNGITLDKAWEIVHFYGY